jgi:uncharacterized protein
MTKSMVWLLSLLAVPTVTAMAQAQSFSCRSADFPDEFLICESPELSWLDERLDRVFRQNMSLLSRAERRALDREEERWVVSRRRCGANHGCIEAHYRARIDELTDRLAGHRGELSRAPATAADRTDDRPAATRSTVPRGSKPEEERAPAARAVAQPPAQFPQRQPRSEEVATPRPIAPSTEASKTIARPSADPAPRRPATSLPARAGREPSEAEVTRHRAPARQSLPSTGSTGGPRIEFADPAR